MASFVLVHGAWGGGWEWQAVAQALRELGNDVWTPTLTGMGDLAHLGGPDVGVETHVADVMSLVELEGLKDIVLCGHSYGGIPVSVAADRLVDRVRLLVYIDALIPRNGESAFDLLPAPFAVLARASANDQGGGWRVPIPAALLPPKECVSEEARQWYVAHLRDQPLRTFSDPVRLTGALNRVLRAFVHCTASDLARGPYGDPIAPIAARARSEGWPYRELSATHDPQLTDPVTTAAILQELNNAV